MNRRSLLVPGIAVCLTVAAPAANATRDAAPHITSTTRAPLVAAQGDRISVIARIAGTGTRVLVGLVLGDPAGSAKGGISLGKGVKVSHRGTQRVVVRGRVPKTVTPRELHTLLVCINPGAAVAGHGACRKAARIATSGRSAEERIAGARQAGRLSAADAILAGLRSLHQNKPLPVELRGAAGPGGDQAAITAAAMSFASLPHSVKKQVFPFFVPPTAVGSAWAPAGPRKSKPKRGSSLATATTADAPDCNTGDYRFAHNLDPGGNGWKWQGVPTSDGKAIVWYVARDYESDDRASAHHYARLLPKIWTKLTTEFGQPISDANEPCYHGGDGRLDLYVNDDTVYLGAGAGRPGLSALAVTLPYPKAGTFCTKRPAFILLRPGLSSYVVAHEFMHVLQFAHDYASCDEPTWNEGQATWAGDFVFPEETYPQRKFPELVTDPVGREMVAHESVGYWDSGGQTYGSWPFWMMLARTQRIDVLRKIFANLATMRTVPAVDAAIPGGFAKQLPKFFVHVWNQSPVGEPGFEITEAFKVWDNWSATPPAPTPSVADLGGLPERTLILQSEETSVPRLSLAGYQRVTIPDANVKELKFTNDLAGRPGAHVNAMLHLADGSWKLADWTTRKDVTLCRDKADENVTELVIVNTNASLTAPLAAFAHKLRLRPSCGPHYYRILKATLNETWTGTKAGLLPACPPATGVQTNTMTLSNVFGPGNNQLRGFPTGLLGTIGALGLKDESTTMHGCDLATSLGCTAFGTGTATAQVMIDVKIPPKSPTAQLQWSLGDPSVGLGSEGAGTSCYISPIGWILKNQSIGSKTVPSDVFEAETPQTVSIDVDFDLTDPVGAQIHASESYSLTIQRVREDGSPL